jgi:hypothetical protein
LTEEDLNMQLKLLLWVFLGTSTTLGIELVTKDCGTSDSKVTFGSSRLNIDSGQKQVQVEMDVNVKETIPKGTGKSFTNIGCRA